MKEHYPIDIDDESDEDDDDDQLYSKRITLNWLAMMKKRQSRY